MRRSFRYGARAGLGNVVRGAMAALLCAVLLFATEPHQFVEWLLAAFAMIFTVFAVRALIKLKAQFELDAEAFCKVGDAANGVRWAELSEVRLDFYTTRRDRDSGWMTLQIRDEKGRAVKVDSDLEGFEEVVRFAEQAANDTGIELSMATRVNMDAVARRRV